jgi:hypothetical protein
MEFIRDISKNAKRCSIGYAPLIMTKKNFDKISKWIMTMLNWTVMKQDLKKLLKLARVQQEKIC